LLRYQAERGNEFLEIPETGVSGKEIGSICKQGVVFTTLFKLSIKVPFPSRAWE